MKYRSVVIPISLMGFILLINSESLQAQDIMNSSGNVKSTQQYYADKAAAEANAKRNAATAPKNNSSSPAYSVPAKKMPLTYEEKKALDLERQIAAEKDISDRKAADDEKATAIKRKASYDSKIGKYQEVTLTKGVGIIRRVKLNDKYGYIDSWGEEMVPLIYDFASDQVDAVFIDNIHPSYFILVRSGKKWGYIDTHGAVQVPIQYDDAKEFSDGKATVKLGDYWGLIDYQGKILLPIKYDEAIIFNSDFGLAPIALAGKYGCIDKAAQLVIPMNYEGIKAMKQGLIGAKQKGKWGFIDKTGAVKIDFQFDDILAGFSGSTATVAKDKAKFNINTGGAQSGAKINMANGETIAEVKATGTFIDKRENKSYNTIKIGEQVWMSQNLDVSKFGFGQEIPEAKTKKEWERADKDHKAAWCYYNNDPANGEIYGKLYNWYAFTDPRGIAPAGWHIPSVEEWRKLVNFLGGKEYAGPNMKMAAWILGSEPGNPSGFNALPAGNRMTDKEMSFVSLSNEARWWSKSYNGAAYGGSYNLFMDDLSEYSVAGSGEGLSIRCIQNENTPVAVTSATAESGNNTTEIKPDENSGSDYSLRMVKVKGKYGYADLSGTMVIQPLYDEADFFSDGLAAVKLGNKYGFIDMKGNMVIAPTYFLATGFSKGYAKVLDKNKKIFTQGYIDKTGQLVIPMIYDDLALLGFSEGCVAVSFGGKWGFVDGKNNIVIPFAYEKVDDFHEGLAAVQLSGKWGYIDKSGKVVLPFIYDNAYTFKKGVANVIVNSISKDIDKNGNEVIVAH